MQLSYLCLVIVFEPAALAVCEEFAFFCLAPNPRLTHAILISLLKGNHDPESEGREKEKAPDTQIFSHNDCVLT